MKERIDKGDRYRWVIVLAGITGLFASLGIGRFSLGMMLPAMGDGLGLNYSQMGIISTINFCGYLGAVLLCGYCVRKMGSRKLIFLALMLVATTMVGVGFSNTYSIILILYFLTGAGSALSNVPIMGLIAVWFDKKSRGRAAGLCVMGNGLGILLTGRLVPYFNNSFGSWRYSWIILGGIAFCAALICLALIRSKTRKNGLAVQIDKKKDGSMSVSKKRTDPKVFYHCGAIYFLFGFTYVIYVTFFVSSLVQDRGLSEEFAGYLWSFAGFISLGSGPLLGYFSDRYGRKSGLVTVFVLQTIAYLAVALQLPQISIYISFICFGLVAWSVPAIIAALVGDYAGPQKATAVFGFVTFLFGIGQIAGPGIAGVLIDVSGSFSSSFYMAALFTAMAAALSVLLPDSAESR